MDNKLELNYNSGILCIKNFPVDNNRKLMKFKLFLNAKQDDIKYKVEEKYIKIRFLCDENIIPVFIEKIESFLNKSISLELVFNDSLEKLKKEKKDADNDFNKLEISLEKLKNIDLNQEEKYKEFCEFCNNNMAITLRPYQYKSAFFLSVGNGGFDFSVPGAGKTIISYAVYRYLKEKNKVSKVLIIGPLNSYNAWHDEYITCFNAEPDFKNISECTMSEAKNYFLMSEKNQNEITFINVDKTWRIDEEIISFMDNKNILLIVDEGHKEKNPNAAITKAVLEITKKAKARIILTGTPMPNGYEDLFSLMKIYSPYYKILKYSYPQLASFTKNGANEEEETNIMNSIKPYYSRVSKKFLLETGELLPPKFKKEYSIMQDEQQELYDFLNGIAKNIKTDWEYEYGLSLKKAIGIRKMQISANPGLLNKSIIRSIDEYKKEYYEEFEESDNDNDMLIKADSFLKKQIRKSNIYSIIGRYEKGLIKVPKNELAVNLAQKIISKGNKVIIWDIFVDNMYVLKKMIKEKLNIDVEIINGNVAGVERQEAIRRFKDKSMILIANPATLAESISLHKVCQNAIYVNRNFNAAQFIQSKDRIHRINMPIGKTAKYYILMNKNTIDEKIDKKLELKESRMLRILDSDILSISGHEFEDNSFMSDEDIEKSYID